MNFNCVIRSNNELHELKIPKKGIAILDSSVSKLILKVKIDEVFFNQAKNKYIEHSIQVRMLIIYNY